MLSEAIKELRKIMPRPSDALDPILISKVENKGIRRDEARNFPKQERVDFVMREIEDFQVSISVAPHVGSTNVEVLYDILELNGPIECPVMITSNDPTYFDSPFPNIFSY